VVTDRHRSPAPYAAAWAVASGIVLVAVLAGYHTILTGQGGSGDQFTTRIVFISVYICGLAVFDFLAAGCLVTDRSTPARPLLMASASGAIALGIVGIFSIGVALFVAAAIELVAATRVPAHPHDRRARTATAVLVALPPIALVAGLALTS